MKSDSTTVIKNMEFLVKELHKEWDRCLAYNKRRVRRPNDRAYAAIR